MCEQPNEAVIRKIQLLLNLGNRGGTEAEADAAMAKAQELLTKYNLDMAVIDAAKDKAEQKAAPEKREKTKIDRAANYKWQIKLCKAIAEANFCWHWVADIQEEEPTTIKGRTYHRMIKRHVVLGSEVNVVAVMMMYGFLADVIEELVPWKGKERLCKSAVSWREGCAYRLCQRIEKKAYEMRHPEEKATEPDSSKMGVVLRSLVKSEYEKNYDALYGEGSYAASQQRWAVEKVKAADAPKVELTEAEKAKQQKASDKWWQKYQRQQQREIDKRDISAFMSGIKAGESISLQDRIHQ